MASPEPRCRQSWRCGIKFTGRGERNSSACCSSGRSGAASPNGHHHSVPLRYQSTLMNSRAYLRALRRGSSTAPDSSSAASGSTLRAVAAVSTVCRSGLLRTWHLRGWAPAGGPADVPPAPPHAAAARDESSRIADQLVQPSDLRFDPRQLGAVTLLAADQRLCKYIRVRGLRSSWEISEGSCFLLLDHAA